MTKEEAIQKALEMGADIDITLEAETEAEAWVKAKAFSNFRNGHFYKDESEDGSTKWLDFDTEQDLEITIFFDEDDDDDGERANKSDSPHYASY
ncbi:hypothetical protein JCM19037_4144 [Geomicrobium sp. JCM 19037]|uniref:hypothetical protein n=1 Tax=Geomicrobium sp. JCM 19037 TaxID=1460634 RepID=UPI00045F41A1|nr:hypothetical protein [Geomicrobium sp. JCM 19037]GAK05631.1 hypothetical protein JCM19037_4144 [Geomicrobium sp. JCM 19037]